MAMHQRERSHLDEWATLLETDVADELLEEQSDAWATEEDTVSGDEAR
jgi:hypothetical protein